MAPRSLSLYLNNPTLTRQEFYEFLAYGVGLHQQVALSKTVFLRELERALKLRRDGGRFTALIVDEAQAMPTELLEEIRLLANLESATTRLLSIALSGQPELASRLNDPVLRPLKQRVALRTTIPPFTIQEAAGYVAKRIRVSGGDAASIFTREAIEAVYRSSRGIPRTMSVVCDNALVTAFAIRARPVTPEIVAEVCADLDLDFDAGDASAEATTEGPALAEPKPESDADTVPVQILAVRPHPASVAVHVRGDRVDTQPGSIGSDVSGVSEGLRNSIDGDPPDGGDSNAEPLPAPVLRVTTRSR